MFQFFLGRLAVAFGVAITLSIVTFLVMNAAIDPAAALAGQDASDERIEQVRVELGLNRPILVQYLSWLGGVLSGKSERQLAQGVRGTRIAMIFQEPMTSLNPVMPIGRQLTEPLKAHARASEPEALRKAIALLERVGIAGAAERMGQYPHQFSGGQRQRIMIAMALMADPELLIADEPTTALDVTVQLEILRMLADLQREHGLGMILVTHNLGVVSRVADRIAVMYAGQVVEEGPAAKVLAAPRHAYTQGLIHAIPEGGPGRLGAIPGVMPSLLSEPAGCSFAPRCSFAEARCHTAQPPLQIDGERQHRCIHVSLPLLPASEAEVTQAVCLTQPVLIEARGLACRYTLRQGLFGRPAR